MEGLGGAQSAFNMLRITQEREEVYYHSLHCRMGDLLAKGSSGMCHEGADTWVWMGNESEHQWANLTDHLAII